MANTTTIKQGQNGPVLEKVPGMRKLAVPARQSWERLVAEVPDRNPIGHDVVVGRVAHDTQPDNPRRGVAFVDVRHSPNCRRCADLHAQKAVLRTMKQVRIPAIVAEACGGLDAIMAAAEKGRAPTLQAEAAARSGDVAATQAAINELASDLEAKRAVERRAEAIRPALEALMAAAGRTTRSVIAFGDRAVGPRAIAAAGEHSADHRIADMLSAIAKVVAVPASSAGPADDDDPAVHGWEIADGAARPVTFVMAAAEWDGEAVKAASIPTPDDWGDFFAGGGAGKARDRRIERTPSAEEAERVRRALAYIERRSECAHRVHERLHKLQHRFFNLHLRVQRCWDGYYGRPTIDSMEAVEAAEALLERATKYPSVRAFVRAMADEVE